MLRTRDVYPGSRILIFTHPGSRIQKQQQKRGLKKNLLSYLLYSHKFHKIEHYFSFEVMKKKILANFQRIIELFTQKLSLALKNMGLGSAIRKNLFRIPDPGSKRHRIPGPDLQHWNPEAKKVPEASIAYYNPKKIYATTPTSLDSVLYK